MSKNDDDDGKEVESVHVGIDIGTTSAKICARKGQKVIFELRENYGTTSSSIQDPILILQICIGLLQKASSSPNVPKIDHIWICGQMHGIVLWNSDSISDFPDKIVNSSLYNWMFEYENSKFLKSLPEWTEGQVYTGFGMATLAYLNKTQPRKLEKFNKCGTIMDLFATILTNSQDVKMSQHNAHSWAYCRQFSWQESMIPFLPSHVDLPTIVDTSEIIGNWISRPKTIVHVPSGDLQASVASLGNLEENTAYLVLGTSAQLCCLVNSDLNYSNLPASVVQLPYSKEKKLIAACSMNGGNALESILRLRLKEKYVNNDYLAEVLDKLENKEEKILPHGVEIRPIFIEERGCPELKLRIERIDRLDDEQLLEATHIGIIRNIFTLFPKPLLIELGIKKLALVGTAQAYRFVRHIQSFVGPDLELVKDSAIVSAPIGATKF